MHRRSSISRRLCGPLAFVLWLGMPSCSSAAINWNESWEVKVNGQRLSVKLFTARMPPDRVSRELARANSAYERYLVADGRILLSGVGDGKHWLAQVQGHADGAQGYVSALYFDHAAAARTGSIAMHEKTTRPRPASPATVHEFQFDASATVGLLSLPRQASPGVTTGVEALKEHDGVSVISLAGHPSMAVAVTMEP